MEIKTGKARFGTKYFWKMLAGGRQPRMLGRKDVLELNVIAGIGQLAQIDEQTPQILGMVDFKEGNRYDGRAGEHWFRVGADPELCRGCWEVRLWIEPAQSFEKNQLGLSDIFCNSLRFTSAMRWLADAVVLLRARALLGRPPCRPLLANLMPFQLLLELGKETTPPPSAE